MKSVKRKPDFLCVGTPKCGTTWLYHNLKRHPQIWLPPVKEFHYFDGLQIKQNSESGRRYYRGRWIRWKRQSDLQLRQLIRSRKKLLSFEHHRWLFKYFLLPRSDRWYASLFPDDPSRISGEIAPSYCWLNHSNIGRVHGINPDLKIIFMIRDPVERAWSQSEGSSASQQPSALTRRGKKKLRKEPRIWGP